MSYHPLRLPWYWKPWVPRWLKRIAVAGVIVYREIEAANFRRKWRRELRRKGQKGYDQFA